MILICFFVSCHCRQYVAAFAVSGLASNWLRVGKPFNPLLGETYQLERPEFRSLSALTLPLQRATADGAKKNNNSFQKKEEVFTGFFVCPRSGPNERPFIDLPVVDGVGGGGVVLRNR